MSKILVVGSSARSLINFRGPLLRTMVDLGYRVIACASMASPYIKKSLLDIGVDYRYVPVDRTSMNILRDLQFTFRLISLFLSEKPDIVLLYTIKPVLYGSLVGKVLRIPSSYSMITGLGIFFSGPSNNLRRNILRWFIERLYKCSMKCNRAVFFQNPDDMGFFLKNGLINTMKNTILINGSGVDTDYFTVSTLPDKLSFLMIARLIRTKGVLEYVNAARILKKEHPEIAFRLVGPVDSNPEAISQSDVEAWVKEGIVDYLGYLEDVRPAIADCTVYVLPSYSEGTPRSVLEAMAMGRPIITTNAPGCKETVIEDLNGFLVPIANVPELAAAMRKFVNNRDIAIKMGEQSRIIAIEKYDVHKVNRVILEAMQLI